MDKEKRKNLKEIASGVAKKVSKYGKSYGSILNINYQNSVLETRNFSLYKEIGEYVVNNNIIITDELIEKKIKKAKENIEKINQNKIKVSQIEKETKDIDFNADINDVKNTVGDFLLEVNNNVITPTTNKIKTKIGKSTKTTKKDLDKELKNTKKQIDKGIKNVKKGIKKIKKDATKKINKVIKKK